MNFYANWYQSIWDPSTMLGKSSMKECNGENDNSRKKRVSNNYSESLEVMLNLYLVLTKKLVSTALFGFSVIVLNIHTIRHCLQWTTRYVQLIKGAVTKFIGCCSSIVQVPVVYMKTDLRDEYKTLQYGKSAIVKKKNPTMLLYLIKENLKTKKFFIQNHLDRYHYVLS